MKFGSLFSGIGGLDLGLERAGMTVAWQSEIDPYACRVLSKHWPSVPNRGDVTTIDWSTVEPVDLICGGYPCQPFSLAGARQGEDDARHLWPHFARAIRELRPRWALLENVPAHLSLGFGSVLGDLAALGFDADWDCIPAAAVGAPHLRYRVFIVAHANEQQHEGGAPAVGRTTATQLPADTDRGRQSRHSGTQRPGRKVHGDEQRLADTGRSRSFVADPIGVAGTTPESRRVRAGSHGESGFGTDQGLRCGGDNWATEPDVGRVADGVPDRVDRLRALGNAVVPQVAEFVGRKIMGAQP